jgi:hypothetical protein
VDIFPIKSSLPKIISDIFGHFIITVVIGNLRDLKKMG